MIFGEWGQYNDQFTGLCGNPFGDDGNACIVNVPTAINKDGTAFTTQTSVNDSEVNRWGVGIVQEIDSAAMHLFARWQHLELNSLTAKNLGVTCVGGGTDGCFANGKFGKDVNAGFQDLDIFQVGGVIFF